MNQANRSSTVRTRAHVDLSEAQVARLATELEVDETHVQYYGEDLGWVLRSTATDGDWLEAAVLTGHLPTLNGIELALRGVQARTLGDIAEWRRTNNGAVPTWLLPSEYYAAAMALLERFICEIRRATVYSSSTSTSPT